MERTLILWRVQQGVFLAEVLFNDKMQELTISVIPSHLFGHFESIGLNRMSILG
jgi:hypothetical protein